MYRPAHLIVAGALMDLALTTSIAVGDLGNRPHLSDTTWFMLDAVALALIGFGLWRSESACRPLGAAWACFAVAHVVISLNTDLAGPLLGSGDILVAITGTVSAALSARPNGWNGKSRLLLLAALSVLAVPLGVAIGGNTGLDIALPLYSLVLLTLGLGLARDQSQQLPISVAA